MASAHIIALPHVVAVGLGLALVASAGRSVVRRPRPRVRTDDTRSSRPRVRTLGRLIGCLLRGAVWLTVTVGLALVTPVGLLCANAGYPLVAPVLAPFEARLAALGHRTGHACCFPLLAWHVWLVRCAGCHCRCFFREVPAAGGTGVELKALGRSGWRTRGCLTEYLTAQPTPAERGSGTGQPTGRRVRPVRPIPPVQPAAAVSRSVRQTPPVDKTA